MNEEIDIGGIKVPAADWESTPESIKQVLKFSREEQKLLKSRREELEEKVKKNSGNSSIPPSKNRLGTKKLDKKSKTKRKPLKLTIPRQKPQRKLYPIEECEVVHEEKPSTCKGCGHELTGSDPHPERHQTVDLPIIKPVLTEYKLHQLECEHCGEKTRASLPLSGSQRC